jgi:branched-chain amino acid transport system ATP-binding protein
VLASGESRRSARKYGTELLAKFDLTRWADMYAKALPHGSERLLGLARAVAAKPRFLLLDEPAAGLDDAESAQLAESIASIRDEYGCGVLLVEHDMRIIFSICESIQVLDFGKTLAIGEAEEVRRDEAVVAAYLGTAGSKKRAEGHDA